MNTRTSDILSDPSRTTRLDHFDEYFSIAIKNGMSRESAISYLYKEAMVRVPQHEWRMNRALQEKRFLGELSLIASEHPVEMDGFDYCLKMIP